MSKPEAPDHWRRIILKTPKGDQVVPYIEDAFKHHQRALAMAKSRATHFGEPIEIVEYKYERGERKSCGVTQPDPPPKWDRINEDTLHLIDMIERQISLMKGTLLRFTQEARHERHGKAYPTSWRFWAKHFLVEMWPVRELVDRLAEKLVMDGEHVMEM